MLSINRSVKKLKPGDVFKIPPGVYRENIKMKNICGTKDAPIHITVEKRDTVIIDGGGKGTAFSIVDCEYITIEGLKVTNAHRGIDIKSTPERGDTPLHRIIITDNEVYGINGPKGGHAISVYGGNPNAPVCGLVIEGNNVHNNKLYWSEAVVVNGNIDGFSINANHVWNNDNIGIDIIGFEGTAGKDPSVDCARNGKVFANLVIGSNTTGNEAYWSANHNPEGWEGDRDNPGPFGGEYDRCCGGIYVDGGHHIEIYRNVVIDNDLGIEVATEHKPPLITKDVHVHDNIIVSSGGWAGLIFGGYAKHLGYTEDCTFTNNILYDNKDNIAVQKSRNNSINGNIIAGGEQAIDFNGDMAASNDFGGNLWSNCPQVEGYFDQLNRLPEEQREKQVLAENLLTDPENGDLTLTKAVPAGFGTDVSHVYLRFRAAHYRGFHAARRKVYEAVDFLQSKIFRATSEKKQDICKFLNGKLKRNDFKGVKAAAVLKTAGDLYMVQLTLEYGKPVRHDGVERAYTQATTSKGVRIR
jgi:parallel beta-helix repeat protein